MTNHTYPLCTASNRIGFADIPLPKTVQIDLWAAGAGSGGARFEDVMLGPVAEEPVAPDSGEPVPAPWLTATLGSGIGSASYTAEPEMFKLTAEGVENTPTTQLVYQSVTDDATIIARVQSLETIDPAGSTGLMIRQDTSPESAYAYLSLTPQGVRFESREGGSAEPAYVEGSSTGAPVWLKLERKEGSVYAYESVDGVNWQLVVNLAFALNGPVYYGVALASPTGNNINSSTIQNVSVNSDSNKGVTYTVNLDEVQGGVRFLSPDGSFAAQQTGTLNLSPPDDFFETIYLLDADGAPVAADVIARSVKETLAFNATNSAKADVVLALTLTGLRNDEIMQAYGSIDENSRFASLVSLYRDAKRLPLSEEAGKAARLIAVDLYEELRDGAHLAPQQVIKDFGGDGTVSIEQRNPDDLIQLTVSLRETYLNQRLIVFESSFVQELLLNPQRQESRWELSGCRIEFYVNGTKLDDFAAPTRNSEAYTLMLYTPD